MGFFQWLVWEGSAAAPRTLACLCGSCHIPPQAQPAPLMSTPGFATDLHVAWAIALLSLSLLGSAGVSGSSPAWAHLKTGSVERRA